MQPIAIDWPVFPEPPEDIVLEGETVRLPLDYWFAIVRYAVAVRRVQDILTDLP